MRRLSRAVACAAALFIMVGATPVLGASPTEVGPPSACRQVGGPAAKTIVIDGREYGPKDGAKVITYECDLEHGSGPVGMEFGGPTQGSGGVVPQATWGSSYAISTEWASQLGYDGKAKADANVFNGQRIIQVCTWYMRGATKVSDTVCSNAASVGGSWLSGPEKRMSVWGDRPVDVSRPASRPAGACARPAPSRVVAAGPAPGVGRFDLPPCGECRRRAEGAFSSLLGVLMPPFRRLWFGHAIE